MDTTVLNLVITQKTVGGQIHITLWQSHDLHEIQLVQKEWLSELKYITDSKPFLTPNHSFKIFGNCKDLNSTKKIQKYGAKTGSGGQECYILKTHTGPPNPYTTPIGVIIVSALHHHSQVGGSIPILTTTIIHYVH